MSAKSITDKVLNLTDSYCHTRESGYPVSESTGGFPPAGLLPKSFSGAILAVIVMKVNRNDFGRT